jgi:butyryl-CoA dehydrogenase
LRTTARLAGDSWIIEGRKRWVSSATGWDRKGAEVLCVLCRTDPEAAPDRSISIILVERPAAAVVFERAIDAAGHRAHLLPQFRFDGVDVLGGNVLGSIGGGLALAAACFTGAAALVGVFDASTRSPSGAWSAPPNGSDGDVRDIVDAVLYLDNAGL